MYEEIFDLKIDQQLDSARHLQQLQKDVVSLEEAEE